MTELVTCWAITEVGGPSVSLKELRKRLTKVAKLAPDNATVTVESKTEPSGYKTQRIAARWTVWA